MSATRSITATSQRSRLLATATGFVLALLSASVFAHHPLGGATPDNFIQGFLSGVGHPVLGLDHLAFVIAAGVLGAMLGRPVLMLAVFICASAVSVFATSGGMLLPGTEALVLISVALIGLGLIARKRFSVVTTGLLLAFAGLAHGAAYGNAVVGAESTPLVAYLIGIVMVQALIAVIAVKLIRPGDQGSDQASGKSEGLRARLAGAVVFGVALTLAVEQLESIIFTA